MLPSLRSLCNIISECWSVIAILLHLSGSVEHNPGPDTIIMQQLLESKKQIAWDVAEIMINQNSFGQRLESIQSSVANLKRLSGEVQKARNQISSLDAFLKANQEKCKNLI